MAPTSASDPKRARQQRLIDPLLHEREWIPLWLAGPLVALVAMLGLIGCVIGVTELMTWMAR